MVLPSLNFVGHFQGHLAQAPSMQLPPCCQLVPAEPRSSSPGQPPLAWGSFCGTRVTGSSLVPARGVVVCPVDLALGAVQILSMVAWFSLSQLAPQLSARPPPLQDAAAGPADYAQPAYIHICIYHNVSALFCVLRPRRCCWSGH